MNRRKAREHALEALFGAEFGGGGLEPEAEGVAEGGGGEFSARLITGTRSRLGELDALIAKAAEHWKIDRMAAVDRNILRLAAYELLYMDDIPTAVTINEALEIAKKYSTGESASFINGILDRIAKGRE